MEDINLNHKLNAATGNDISLNNDSHFIQSTELISSSHSNQNLTIQVPKLKSQLQNHSMENHELNQIAQSSLLRTQNLRESSSLIHKAIFSSQKSADLQLLINETDLSGIIKANPWQFDIKKTLEQYQNRMYDNPKIKFQIGGRVIYSSAKIVKAKSSSVIYDSQTTQDDLQVNEMDVDDLGDPEEFYECENPDGDLNSTVDASSFYEEFVANPSDQFYGIDQKSLNSIEDAGFEMEELISPHSFYTEDKEGKRYLSSPMRSVYKKIDFSDLGKALVKSLNYQIRSPKCNTKASQKVLASDILPENVLKKAEEERALVELQIQKMFEKIVNMYSSTTTVQKEEEFHEPVSFLKLIIKPDRAGIVQTFLYLLHLVNRKKIELWQKMDEEMDDKISKNKKNDEEHEQLDSELNSYLDSQSGTDIYITPCMPYSS